MKHDCCKPQVPASVQLTLPWPHITPRAPGSTHISSFSLPTSIGAPILSNRPHSTIQASNTRPPRAPTTLHASTPLLYRRSSHVFSDERSPRTAPQELRSTRRAMASLPQHRCHLVCPWILAVPPVRIMGHCAVPARAVHSIPCS